MQKGSNLTIWVLILGMVLFAAYSLYNRSQGLDAGSSNTSKVGANAGAIGQLAPEIVLRDLQGQTLKLSDYRGKVVVLNFWASWCPPCKAEMPDIDQMAAELGVDQFGILLAVNMTDGSRETESKARQYIIDNRFSMRVLLDKGGKAADAYSISSIPTTFIIDKEGRIYTYMVGSTTKETLRSYINQLR
jgi:cytochrome c biogenesis protein CcmG, thiol:disulfide interchange protein DsbE